MFHNPYVLLVLATLFWGGNFALGKAVSGSFPPMTLSYLRWTEALIIFLPFAYKEIKAYKLDIIKNWKTFASLGITGVMGFNICVYLSVQYTTAINASLINSCTPIVVILLSIIFLKEKLSIKQGLGIIISLFGVVWIIIKGDWQQLLSLTFNKGDLIMIFAIILWGIYTIILKKKGKVSTNKTVFIASIIGGLIITLPLIIYENYYTGLAWISKLTIMHYLSLLYFGIFPTILSFLFYNKALLQIGPSRASVSANLVFIFASIIGVAFLNERLTWAHILGGPLIVLGVYLTSQTENIKNNR